MFRSLQPATSGMIGRTFGMRLAALAIAAGLAVCQLASPAAAQIAPTGTIVGRTLDADGAPVVDVAVTLRRADATAPPITLLTDAAGVFRFAGLAPGRYTLATQRLGLASESREVAVVAGQSVSLTLTLTPDALLLEGVVAEGLQDANRERARFDTEPGVTARVVEARTLRVLPGLAEADVLRAVSLLPGVISTSDFSSSYNVRGGSADQNLILIDGFTVFNPVHLGGLFSVFNADAVERAELFAGGFGAEFGGRVSSVLNIESRSATPEGVEVAGGVSMLATRLLARGPVHPALPGALGGSEGSWFVSARRSYFDQILRPVADFPYHLTDLQAGASLGTRGGGRISFTGYWGQDVLDLSDFGSSDGGEASDVLRLRWNWGNQVAGVRLVQPLAAAWVLDSRLGLSRFGERLGFADFGDVNFQGRIEQAMWRGDLSRDFSTALSLRFGLAADRLAHRNVAEAGGTTFFEADGSGVLGAGYASVRWRPARWIVEPGARWDLWMAGSASRNVFSPRFSVKRFLGPQQNVAVKLAVGRYSQFLHSLRDEELPVSNDTWVLSDESVPPVISDQVQLGVESFWGAGWSASLEGYLRTFDGVTDVNYADDPNDPTDNTLVGEGRSHGLDMLLRRGEGRVTGWAGLSLLRAERTFPDPLAAGWDDLPQTVTYPPIFDRRINFDLVAQYASSKGLEVGARWNYGSGLPYTRPVAQHLSWRHHPIWGRSEPFGFGFEGGEVPLAIVLGDRNAERYPAYHRLDVTVRRTYERSWGSFVPYLQVLNVYNRKNVLFYFYDYNRTQPTRSGFSMFPFLPAVGVEVAF